MDQPLGAEWFQQHKRVQLTPEAIDYYSRIRRSTSNLDDSKHYCPLCKVVKQVKVRRNGDVTCDTCNCIVTTDRMTDSADVDVSATGGFDEENGGRVEKRTDVQIAQWLGIEYIPSTSFYVTRNYRGTKAVSAMVKCPKERFIDSVMQGMRDIERIAAGRRCPGQLSQLAVVYWMHFSKALTNRLESKHDDEKALYKKNSRIAACLFVASQHCDRPLLLHEAAYVAEVVSKKPKKTVLRQVNKLIQPPTGGPVELVQPIACQCAARMAMILANSTTNDQDWASANNIDSPMD